MVPEGTSCAEWFSTHGSTAEEAIALSLKFAQCREDGCGESGLRLTAIAATAPTMRLHIKKGMSAHRKTKAPKLKKAAMIIPNMVSQLTLGLLANKVIPPFLPYNNYSRQLWFLQT